MPEVYSSVLEYLQKNFPSPFYLKTNKYEIGTVLYTANPYIRTNATIISILKEGSMYQVLTDIGNIVDQHITELQGNYLPPVCKRTSESSFNEKDYFSLKAYLNTKEKPVNNIPSAIEELGLVEKPDAVDALKNLGEFVLFEAACDHLGYNPMLSQIAFVDHYMTDSKSGVIALSVNEAGKTPKKVKFNFNIMD